MYLHCFMNTCSFPAVAVGRIKHIITDTIILHYTKHRSLLINKYVSQFIIICFRREYIDYYFPELAFRFSSGQHVVLWNLKAFSKAVITFDLASLIGWCKRRNLNLESMSCRNRTISFLVLLLKYTDFYTIFSWIPHMQVCHRSTKNKSGIPKTPEKKPHATVTKYTTLPAVW